MQVDVCGKCGTDHLDPDTEWSCLETQEGSCYEEDEYRDRNYYARFGLDEYRSEEDDDLTVYTPWRGC